jgi:hypothetical protein
MPLVCKFVLLWGVGDWITRGCNKRWGVHHATRHACYEGSRGAVGGIFRRMNMDPKISMYMGRTQPSMLERGPSSFRYEPGVRHRGTSPGCNLDMRLRSSQSAGIDSWMTCCQGGIYLPLIIIRPPLVSIEFVETRVIHSLPPNPCFRHSHITPQFKSHFKFTC